MVKELFTGQKELDWRQVLEVRTALDKQAQLEKKVSELTDAAVTAKEKAIAVTEAYEQCDLSCRVGRATEKQRDGAKVAAERALDASKQAQAEEKAAKHDLAQQEKAIAMIIPDAMRRVAKNLREDQLRDEKEKLVLLEKMVAIDERQNTRLSSAQVQFRFDDAIRGEAGLSAAAGLPRFPSKGISRRLLEHQQARMRAFEKQLTIQEVA